MSGKGRGSNHERIGKLFTDLLDDPMTVALHAGYLRMLGGDSNTAILLAQIVFWSDKGGGGEHFYKSTPEWTSELSLSRDKIDRSRKVLEDLGIISVTAEMAKGSMTNHYTLDLERLQELITEFASTGKPICGKATRGKPTGGKPAGHMRETRRSPVGNPQVAPVGNPQVTCGKPAGLYTENTTENTNREYQSTRTDGARDSISPLDGFYRLWEAYPNKNGEGRARSAWMELDPDEELQATMLEAVEKQRSNPQWKELRYVPWLVNWINNEGWKDSYDNGRYIEPDDSAYGGDIAMIMAMVREEAEGEE